MRECHHRAGFESPPDRRVARACGDVGVGLRQLADVAGVLPGAREDRVAELLDRHGWRDTGDCALTLARALARSREFGMVYQTETPTAAIAPITMRATPAQPIGFMRFSRNG